MQEDCNSGATKPSEQTKQLTAQLAAMDATLRTARRELTEAREVHAREFAQAMQPSLVAYGSLLHAVINLMDEAVGVGSMCATIRGATPCLSSSG
jgi:erythromycin esterase-like protein